MHASIFENYEVFKMQGWHTGCVTAVLLTVLSPGLAIGATAQPVAQKPSAAIQKKTPRAERKSAVQKSLVAEAKPAPEQAAPKPPDWPANDKPAEASVVWNSKGLRIDAANSSLEQILNDVATATGARISGMDADQRVFGIYGPGPARDVLSQLLYGSGYNVLMIGDQGQGTPKQIVLSKPPTGPAPSVTNNPSPAYEESSPDVEEPPQQLPPPMQPQNGPPNGAGPANQPRTPQQILQEMQQRQQVIEQMQQQQNNTPPNQ